MLRRVLSVLLLLAGVGQAATIRVPGDQPTIQRGIYAAAEGDTVLVAEGTYYERFAFRGVNILVLGDGGAHRTTIEGDAQGSVVAFESGETAATVLAGFTIRNGNDEYGGGIYCYSSSPTITNCTISGNAASFKGGGLHCSSASPTITNCTISENSANDGGGIYCSSSSPTITNCILWGDHPSEIYLSNSSPKLTYCDVEGDYPGEGNFDFDPQFVAYRGYDYLLHPRSPCIDAGDLSIQDGREWPARYKNSLISDMGAYGGPGNVGWLE